MPDPFDSPTRSDLGLWAQALRNDWPIPPAVKTRLLQVAINLADPADEDDLRATRPDEDGKGEFPVFEPPERIKLGATRDRTKLAALRVVAAFCRISLLQQQLDLSVRKLDGRSAVDQADAERAEPAAAAAALKAARDAVSTRG